jgi:hypothetical protein
MVRCRHECNQHGNHDLRSEDDHIITPKLDDDADKSEDHLSAIHVGSIGSGHGVRHGAGVGDGVMVRVGWLDRLD